MNECKHTISLTARKVQWTRNPGNSQVEAIHFVRAAVVGSIHWRYTIYIGRSIGSVSDILMEARVAATFFYWKTSTKGLNAIMILTQYLLTLSKTILWKLCTDMVRVLRPVIDLRHKLDQSEAYLLCKSGWREIFIYRTIFKWTLYSEKPL